MVALRIIDWDVHFENAASRVVDQCRWCPVPNKQDGLSYRRLARSVETAGYYAVWVAVVLMCSKQRKPRQGWLTDSGRPEGRALSVEDIALKTGLPAELIRPGLEYLCSEDIGWITSDGAADRAVLAAAAAEPDPTMVETERIRFDRERGTFVGITEADMKGWAEAYPAVGLQVDLKQAALWLRSHKVSCCMLSFLGRWFARSQRSGGNGSPATLVQVKAANARARLAAESRAADIEAYGWAVHRINSAAGRSQDWKAAELARVAGKVQAAYRDSGWAEVQAKAAALAKENGA